MWDRWLSRIMLLDLTVMCILGICRICLVLKNLHLVLLHLGILLLCVNICGIGVSGSGSFLQFPFFLRNFHVQVIHNLVLHLVSYGKLLSNMCPEQPMSSLLDCM